MNKVASVEDVTPAGRVAKRCTQSLRNAAVPRAKSLPHINIVAEGRSLKARCPAVLHGDLDNTSPKHRVETARRPGGSISAEPASPTTASTVGSSSPMISSSSPVISDTTCSDQWEEDEYHCHRLLAVTQSWLDFEPLFLCGFCPDDRLGKASALTSSNPSRVAPQLLPRHKSTNAPAMSPTRCPYLTSLLPICLPKRRLLSR
ncbi:hypothetical protein L210DRAFT_2071805 [Boletus edulis BED1]|uniref:Uncharacterized protein n=1 Tax=Boletus edulis BED1 TaxID=1328754 RepID=A0AAD4GF51_BOLED|nr:hypothetical protein L210DRAFT_2071805 [Boletus edulis BED1]